MRVFAQYSPDEKVAVLEHARASAQSQLHEERDRAYLLEMRLNHAEHLLRRAMTKQPFKRATKRFLSEFGDQLSSILL